jgi:transposase
MLIVETIGRIRREHLVLGKTIREIARDLKLSRNTVRKVLRSAATTFSYGRQVQPLPKLGRWTQDLDRLLARNAEAPARERLTLIRIFEELRALGYGGGYDAVRRYARRWSKAHASATASAFVPLTFAPGEAYQFDWSHEVVVMNGVTTTVKVAHVRLCRSRMMFVRAYPRETQEMVFDAHDRAFVFFRGACARGVYDNMKTAVEAVFVGKDRQYNRRFLQMCSHYLVEPVACTPASGWEKGQVENQVGLVAFFGLVPALETSGRPRCPARLRSRRERGEAPAFFAGALQEPGRRGRRQVIEGPRQPGEAHSGAWRAYPVSRRHQGRARSAARASSLSAREAKAAIAFRAVSASVSARASAALSWASRRSTLPFSVSLWASRACMSAGSTDFRTYGDRTLTGCSTPVLASTGSKTRVRPSLPFCRRHPLLIALARTASALTPSR